MERTEDNTRSRTRRRKVKTTTHGNSSHKKSAVTPVSFTLQTELLAEKRRLQREEKEVVQLRQAQQRILGKKVVEDFAQLKLIRRETAATRSRSLHCNEKPSKPIRRSKESELSEVNNRISENNCVHLQSRPLMSARLSRPQLASDSLPQRPQSAKPVLQSHSRCTAGHTSARLGSDEDIELLEDMPAKAHPSKKKRKKKTVDRKSSRLTPSQSTPVLSNPDVRDTTEGLPVGKKINIVVNMRNLQLRKESPSEIAPPLNAWGD